MVQRLLHVTVPETSRAQARALIEGLESADAWYETRHADLLGLSAIVPADESERIMDALENAFGAEPGFRIVLLP